MSNEKLISAARKAFPENRTIAALCGALEASDARIAELQESHAQVIHSRDHYKQVSEFLASRSAELQSRAEAAESRTVTVKLPQRLHPGADGFDDWYVHSDDDGEYLRVDDVVEMLTAAGIQIQGGESCD